MPQRNRENEHAHRTDGGPANPVSRAVYIACAAFLVVGAVWHLFTGARTKVIPMKLCPAAMFVAAVCIFLGMVLHGGQPAERSQAASATTQTSAATGDASVGWGTVGYCAAAASAVAAAVAAFLSWRAVALSNRTTEADLVMRLNEQFDGPHMRERRRSAACYAARTGEGDKTDATAVLNMLDLIGVMVKRKAISDIMAWEVFGSAVMHYRETFKDYIKKQRDDEPAVWENVVELNERVLRIERAHRSDPTHPIVPSPKQIEEFLVSEMRFGGGSGEPAGNEAQRGTEGRPTASSEGRATPGTEPASQA